MILLYYKYSVYICNIGDHIQPRQVKSSNCESVVREYFEHILYWIHMSQCVDHSRGIKASKLCSQMLVHASEVCLFQRNVSLCICWRKAMHEEDGYTANHVAATNHLKSRGWIVTKAVRSYSWTVPFSACTYIYVGKSAGAKHPNVLHRISVALQVAVYGYLQWRTAEVSRKNMFCVTYCSMCLHVRLLSTTHIFSECEGI